MEHRWQVVFANVHSVTSVFFYIFAEVDQNVYGQNVLVRFFNSHISAHIYSHLQKTFLPLFSWCILVPKASRLHPVRQFIDPGGHQRFL